MKKCLSIFICFLMVVSLGACAAKPAPATPAAPAEAAAPEAPAAEPAAAAPENAEKVVLRAASFVGTETEQNFWNMYAERFSEAFPQYDLQFEFADTSAPEEFIKSKIAAGDFPDTMWVFQPALLINGNIIQEMPKELEDMLIDPEPYKVNGKLYTMPIQSGALGMWYNKAIFQEAGVETVPADWAEYMGALEKIKAIGIEPVGMSAKEAWFAAGMFKFLWSGATYGPEPHWSAKRTAGEVKFNNEVTRRSMEQYAETIPYWQEGYLSASYDEVKSLFYAGQVAIMANGGQYNAGELNSGDVEVDFEIGYMQVPQDNAADTRVVTFSDNLFVISSQATGDKLTAVTDYLKYFFSEDVYPDFLTSYVSFPTVKGFENNGARVENPISKVMMDELYAAMNDLGTVPYSHATQGDDMWPAGCREMSEKIAQEIAAGNTDFDSLMNLMDDQWDTGVEQANAQ